MLICGSGYFDGWLGRKQNSVTRLGAILDLLADKLLVCLLLIWLSVDKSLSTLIPILLIISREIAISTVRQYLSEFNASRNLKVSFSGKLKTTSQLIAIAFLIISPFSSEIIKFLALISLWIACFMSLYSFLHYLISWKDILFENKIL